MQRAILFAAFGLMSTLSMAAEPRWSPVIIARGEYREHLQSLPIEQRPNRPLHVYGNSVRRQHNRGGVLPMPNRTNARPSR